MSLEKSNEKISGEKRLKKIENEVREIIDNFMKKLKVVEFELKEEDFYLIKNNDFREDITKENKENGEINNILFIEKWKKTWNKFDKDNYLLAEKRKWKNE